MASQKWTSESIAWVAGLLEGEGSFTLTGSPSGTYKNGDPQSRQPRVTCGSTDRDTLERLERVTGVGAISRESRRDPRRLEKSKPFWVWSVAARADVIPLLLAIRPWMSNRRGDRIDELLQYHKDNPPKYNTRASHGTLTRFRSGCRCEECEPVRSEYNRIQNERYYARKEKRNAKN